MTWFWVRKVHRTATCQIASATGSHHSSVHCIIHHDRPLKWLKKGRRDSIRQIARHVWLATCVNNNNNNNNNNTWYNVYGAVIMTQVISRVQPGECIQRQATLTKPTDLGCEPPIGYYCLHPPSPFIITEPESWYSFYRPTECRRLSQLHTIQYKRHF